MSTEKVTKINTILHRYRGGFLMLFFKDEYIDSFPLEDRCIPAEKSNFL